MEIIADNRQNTSTYTKYRLFDSTCSQMTSWSLRWMQFPNHLKIMFMWSCGVRATANIVVIVAQWSWRKESRTYYWLSLKLLQYSTVRTGPQRFVSQTEVITAKQDIPCEIQLEFDITDPSIFFRNLVSCNVHLMPRPEHSLVLVLALVGFSARI